MKRLLQLPFAVAIALTGADAWALGLGPVHVNSGLNQPLNAEIPVIAGSAAEADGLVAQLASDQEFERVGLSRSRIGVPLSFNVVKGPRGDIVIKVTSKEPVRQTFIDFLVEANWPKGRVLREYTLLLDPPVTAPVSQPASSGASSDGPGSVSIVRPAAKPAPPAERPTPPPANASVPAPAVVPARPAPPPPPPPAPRPIAAPAPTPTSTPASASAAGEYGPVEAGDNLISIARAQPLDGVNLDQMMLALLKANPDAFYKPNINALKRGAILRIPSAEQAREAGSVSAAAAQVRSQIEDWRGARATPTLVAGTSAPATAAAGKANAKPTAASASPRDRARLELVPPKSGDAGTASSGRPGSGTDAGGMQGVRAELSQTREALASAQQESTDLKSRVGELETLKEKNDRLLSLKDSEIADLQAKLKALQQADGKGTSSTAAMAGANPIASADVAGKPAAKPESAPTSTPTAMTPASTTTEKSPTGTDGAVGASTPTAMTAAKTQKTESPTSESPASVAATPPTTVQPTAASTPAAVTPPTPKPATPVTKPKVAPANTAPRSMLDDVMQQDWFMPAALAGGALVLLLVVLGLRRRASTTKPRSSLTDAFADSSLVADGKHASSISSAQDLRRQLIDNPGNAGLYLELLSTHYAERDVAAFEADAADMHAHVADENGPEWREAQAMGRELAPANPLFQPAGFGTRLGAAAGLAAGAAAFGLRDEDDKPMHEGTVARSEHPFGFDRASEGEATGHAADVGAGEGMRAYDVDAADHVVSPEFDHLAREDHTRNDVGTNDISLGFPTQTEAALSETANADAHTNPFGLDLDNERDAFVPPAQHLAAPAMPAESRYEHLLEFEHETLPFDGASNERDEAVDSAIADDRVESDLTASRAAYDFPGSDDAISTKLDLARAYMDMGDPDGARAMLGEVVVEGSDAQKTEAERLLSELG